MNFKITFLLAFLFIGFNGYAQQRTCGTDAFMQEQMNNPEFRAQYEARQAKFEEKLKQNKKTTSNRRMTIYIPVAVHFVEGNEADRACLEAMAQNQVDVLNNDFRGTNEDLSQWNDASTSYPGINTGALDIQFIIATQNHPANTDPDLIEGEKAVTIGYNWGNGMDHDANWSGYMNFVIRTLEPGILGYSPLGGSPAAGATIVMAKSFFGSGDGCTGHVPQAPYDLGRTVTHELGHFFNLDHTWGDGGCGSDDYVEDTPNITGPTGGCPTAGSVTMCGNKSLTMNFMDYVNDACMYMLTEGQADRALTYLGVIEDEYNTNVLSVEEFEAEKVFAIFPNPADNEIMIQSTSNVLKNGASIQLFDMLGRIVKDDKFDSSLEQEKVDVSNLNEGVYLLKIASENFSTTKKIVIKRN